MKIGVNPLRAINKIEAFLILSLITDITFYEHISNNM